MSTKHPNRRSFLTVLSALPGMGALLPAARAAAPRDSQPRDVIAELGVRPLINAAGTYTSLTASLMAPEVFAAMQVASRKFAPLGELHDAVGARIAELLRCEAALVSAGCASALSLATAACVAGSDRDKIRQIPDTHNLKNEVIIQASHRNGYDHAIRNAGIQMIEVETAQQLERAINHRTAMMAFFNFASPDGKIGHEEFVAAGKKHGIPTLIDAAADVPPAENLFRFTKLGFDLVAFSGGKGLCGPQSAGLLLGRKDLIAAARLNDSPNSDSMGRTNKVNKEELVGMLVALELFLGRDHQAVWKDWEARCSRIAAAVGGIKTVKTETFVPEIANAVPHLRIAWDEKAVSLTPPEAARKMREGKPSIEVRPGAREVLEIAVWMLEPGEDEIVARRLREVLQGA
jgi:L-seryl-tRNA(Ser) seleniumtransferase